MYTCTVCGYNKLEFPPDDYNICPSCGTEFDVTDAGISHESLRFRWKANGCKWWSRYQAPPNGWDPRRQLMVFEMPTQTMKKEIMFDFSELYWSANGPRNLHA